MDFEKMKKIVEEQRELDRRKFKYPGRISHNKRQGWICPICGKGLSPSTSSCPCVPTSLPDRTLKKRAKDTSVQFPYIWI